MTDYGYSTTDCDATITGYWYSVDYGTSATISWYSNNTTYSPTWYVYSHEWTPVEVRPETEEEKKSRLKLEEELRIKAETLRLEQEAAVRQAEELLKEHIGLEAFGSLAKSGYFELDSQKYKGRKYRIPNDERYIEVVDENGKVIDTLCVHTKDVECPMPDRVLTRALLLQLAEEHILAIANSHGGRYQSELVRVN